MALQNIKIKLLIENDEIDNIEKVNENININEQKNRKKGKGIIKDIRYYNQYLFPSLRQGYGYIISIIDYFQYFNFFKVIEANVVSKFKTGFNKDKNNAISCVKPDKYSERFIEYINQLTDISKIKEYNKDNLITQIEEIEKDDNSDNEEENIIKQNINSKRKKKQ